MDGSGKRCRGGYVSLISHQSWDGKPWKCKGWPCVQESCLLEVVSPYYIWWQRIRLGRFYLISKSVMWDAKLQLWLTGRVSLNPPPLPCLFFSFSSHLPFLLLFLCFPSSLPSYFLRQISISRQPRTCGVNRLIFPTKRANQPTALEK